MKIIFIAEDAAMDEQGNSTMLPTQITPQSGTEITPQSGTEIQYQSSQSATGSSQSTALTTTFTMPESQQVISLAEVRMSELIEGAAETERLPVENPLETQPIAEEQPQPQG